MPGVNGQCMWRGDTASSSGGFSLSFYRWYLLMGEWVEANMVSLQWRSISNELQWNALLCSPLMAWGGTSSPVRRYRVLIFHKSATADRKLRELQRTPPTQQQDWYLLPFDSLASLTAQQHLWDERPLSPHMLRLQRLWCAPGTLSITASLSVRHW